MPEPIATIWLVALGTGGYVLAVVQFFKDFLGVRKLEFEIAELRRAREERERIVVKASPDEIQRFGRPLESPSRARTTSSIVVMGIALLGSGLLVTQVLEQGTYSSPKPAPSNSPDIETLHRMLDERRQAQTRLESENQLLSEQLLIARREIDALRQPVQKPEPASSAALSQTTK